MIARLKAGTQPSRCTWSGSRNGLACGHDHTARQEGAAWHVESTRANKPLRMERPPQRDGRACGASEGAIAGGPVLARDLLFPRQAADRVIGSRTSVVLDAATV